MKQSDLRVAGRTGNSAWAPRIDPVDEPEPEPERALPTVTLDGLGVALPVTIVPDAESLKVLHQVVRDTVYAAVRDGLLEAVADMVAEAEDDESDADGEPSPG